MAIISDGDRRPLGVTHGSWTSVGALRSLMPLAVAYVEVRHREGSVQRHKNEGGLCVTTLARLVCMGLGVLAIGVATAVADMPYEVWGIDQSNSQGRPWGYVVHL